MESQVVMDLGTTIVTIGVMIALFVRLDRRIDGVESRIDHRDAELNGRMDKQAEEFNRRFDKQEEAFNGRFDKQDGRFDRQAEEFNRRFDKQDAKFDAMAADIVEIKVSVARIEGYLEARDGFRPAGADRRASSPAGEQETVGYRQTG